MAGGAALAEKMRELPDGEGLTPLPEGWDLVRISAVARLRSEKADPQSDAGLRFVGMDDIRTNGLKVIQTRAFSEMKSLGNRFHAGDLLYGRLRPYLNKTAVVGEEGACSGELLVIETTPAIDVRYLQFFLHSRRFVGWVSSVTSGDRPRISFETAANFEISLAPLAEQRRIVARVDALFAEIAEGEAALAAARRGLDTFRRALLKAAVTGELTKDWREKNTVTETGHDLLARIVKSRAAKAPAKGRPHRTARPLETSFLPNFPEGWCRAALADMVISGPTNGYSPKKSNDGTGTLALKLTATTKGHIDLSSRAIKALSETISAGSDLFLKPGDLLFQRGNTVEYVGIAAIYEGPADKYIYPDLMIRVRTTDPSVAEWIWRVANSPQGRKYMSDNATGTAGTMPKISGEILRNFPVPIPPPAEATEILRRVSDALAASADTLAVLDAEAADAARLKQSILKAAFEGRLSAQDPAEEPASALLARLATKPTVTRAKRGRAKRDS
jgi:type I restriction enzyme S subunit